MIEQNDPNYSPRQRMDARLFETIQGTIGINRKG